MATEVNSIPSSAARIILAREQSVGVLPGSPQFFDLDANSVSDDTGPTFELISRRVVNQRRRLRGSIGSARVASGFEIDVTQTVLERLVEAMMLSTTAGQPKKGTVFDTGLAVSGTGYDIGADAATAGWQDGHLLYAENFDTAANNGLKEVTGTTGNEVEVTGLTAEASPPDTASIRAVGIQFGSGDLDVVKNVGEFPQLVIAAGLLSWTDFNIVPGSRIYIDKANGAASNRFVNASNNGSMRVLSVTATTLTIDRADGGADLATDMVTETGTGLSIRVFLSDRTVDAAQESDANFSKISHFIERRLGIPNPIANPGVEQSEDLDGNVVSEFTVAVNAEDKTTINLSMLAIGSDEHTGLPGDLITTDGQTILAIPRSEFFNNSSNVFRSILAIYDASAGDAAPDPLIEFATEYEISFSNGASILPAVGTESGIDVNVNGLTADISLTNYYTEATSKRVIRNNQRAQFEIGWLREFNGRNVATLLDFPSGSLGNGRVSQTIDATLTQPITIEAAESEEHDQTASINLFWFIP